MRECVHGGRFAVGAGELTGNQPYWAEMQALIGDIPGQRGAGLAWVRRGRRRMWQRCFRRRRRPSGWRKRPKTMPERAWLSGGQAGKAGQPPEDLLVVSPCPVNPRVQVNIVYSLRCPALMTPVLLDLSSPPPPRSHPLSCSACLTAHGPPPCPSQRLVSLFPLHSSY